MIYKTNLLLRADTELNNLSTKQKNIYGVYFENGNELRFVTVGMPPRLQAILYDGFAYKGRELAHSKIKNDCWGKWIVTNKEDTYIVNVREV